jgi:hypothetical protein
MVDRAMEQLGRDVLKAAARHGGDGPVGQLAQSVLDGEISLSGLAAMPFLADDLAHGLHDGLDKRDEFSDDPMLRRLTSETDDQSDTDDQRDTEQTR